MVFLVVKFIHSGRNEVVLDCWTTKDDMCYWPQKDPQAKVRRGDLLKTCWPEYAIKKLSAHRKFSSFCGSAMII
jgi:hypothetical protein